MDNKTWFAVHVKAAPQATEAVEFALNSLDALGTEVIDFPREDNEIETVTGYFDRLPDKKQLRDKFDEALRIYDLLPDSILSVETDQIENADWLAEWKRHWKPTNIGRFVVAAPWHVVDEENKIVIRIEPNMAFGTGTHETTQLCLAAIEKNLSSGDSFLDVGTGTGILSIAAARITGENPRGGECASTFLAIDNDPDSIKIARENSELNTVGARIEFQTASLSEAVKPYDFVCANLTLDVILPILPVLIEKANRILVLSGILAEQKKEIADALKRYGSQNVDISRAGEWIALTIRKT